MHLHYLLAKTTLSAFAFIYFYGITEARNTVAKGNEFTDQLLHKMKNDRSAVYSLDPLYVPNIKASAFETNDLTVRGLSRLHRVGGCSVVDPQKDPNSVVCRMSAGNLTVDFAYWAKALIVWFNGEGTVKIDQLVVEMVFTFRPDQKPVMDRLEVIKLEDFHVEKINGLSVVFNWLLKHIAESVFNRAKDSLKEAVEKTAKHSLREVMAEKKAS